MPRVDRSNVFDTKQFSADLVDFCEQNKLSLREMGRRSGVSPSTLTRVVRGDVPATTVLYALADTAGLDLRVYGATRSDSTETPSKSA